MSAQTRLPKDHVTIEGQSKTWTFPNDGNPVTFRSCDSGGATYHFCPECGSTVYWDISIAPDVLGAGVGGFTDPTFPPPMISGFEVFGPAWTMNLRPFRCRTTKTMEHQGAGHEPEVTTIA